ncbi:MAG: hypothetical protein IKB23_00175 [Clostridia bacterium]|nr:hypothetical protein [Clostridia bacterium]
MLYIRIADLNICINNKYDYLERLCRDYTVEKTEKPDMTVSVTDEQIAHEVSIAETQVSAGYAEGVCAYREICKRLPVEFGAYLFHSAVIEYKGDGFAFAAKSGTGKSTHISLWRKRFGSEVHVVNGDKPIMRFVDDKLYAYGTPWCGKEGWQNNTSVPLKALCFVERSDNNRIRRIGADEAVMLMFHQILTPSDLETVDALFPLLDRTLREVPCYVLGCNISEEAAEVAYNGMK